MNLLSFLNGIDFFCAPVSVWEPFATTCRLSTALAYQFATKFARLSLRGVERGGERQPPAHVCQPEFNKKICCQQRDRSGNGENEENREGIPLKAKNRKCSLILIKLQSN